jgi:predicted phosphodiesterase
MDNKLKILTFLIISITFFRCNSDIDFSGFFRSTDRVEERFAQSDEWNASHPFSELISNFDNYNLMIASDIHIGPTENFSLLKNIYQNSTSTALILVGDIVSGKKEDYITFRDSALNISKPKFYMLGNHDLFFDGWKTYYEFFGTSTYYFSVTTPTAKDLFICLDSGGGTLGKSQMNWLENVLKNERGNYRYCIVFSHVNILRTRRTTSSNPLVEEVSFLLDLFARYKINYVINGHDHVRNTTIFGNTTYVITDALMDSNSDASYVILNIDNTDISHNFIKL